MLLDVLEQAGLTGPDQELPAAVRVRSGTTPSGRTQRYHFDYSGAEQVLVYPYAPGRDLLTDRPVAPGEELTLTAWDLAIVEE